MSISNEEKCVNFYAKQKYTIAFQIRLTIWGDTQKLFNIKLWSKQTRTHSVESL